jgi:hypothetical protein
MIHTPTTAPFSPSPPPAAVSMTPAHTSPIKPLSKALRLIPTTYPTLVLPFQHFFCNRSTSTHVTILAPRWTREIAGFMPWSVLDYLVESSYVEVGDDALAIMSGADEAGRLWPTRGLTFRRLFVRGAWVVALSSQIAGSETFTRDCFAPGAD